MWMTHGMMYACHVGDTWHDACMPCGCSGLFRTDFSVVWTKKSGLIEDLVGQVLASGCSSIRGCLRPGWELLCG